jgi:hypothetical protein
MGVLRGISVEQVDYSNVPAVGYTEKRATTDGIHASDVYLGPRQIDMNGLIYASTVAEVFDTLRLLRVVFNAPSAYTEAPVDKGFIPIRYSQPTMDEQSFPGGNIDLFINVRPAASPQFTINRDRLVGFDKRPQAIPWRAALLARDPRVYVSPAQTIPLNTNFPITAQAINRGDYEAPLNILLVTGSTAPPAGTFRLQGFGVDMTIKIEAKANTVYRWRGDDRTLMTQSSLSPNSAEALRMDLVTFVGKNKAPKVPAEINPSQRPFSTQFTATCTVPLAAGSRLFWNEAFA